MPHTLRGKNKLDRNIHLNRNISEVKNPAGSLRREERKHTHTHARMHTHTQARLRNNDAEPFSICFQQLLSTLFLCGWRSIDRNETSTFLFSVLNSTSYVRTAVIVQDWLEWIGWSLKTDLAGCCGPRRSVCSPLRSSQSRHRRTRWSSMPQELLSRRQTGSPRRGPPSPRPLGTQRATANTRETLELRWTLSLKVKRRSYQQQICKASNCYCTFIQIKQMRCNVFISGLERCWWENVATCGQNRSCCSSVSSLYTRLTLYQL